MIFMEQYTGILGRFERYRYPGTGRVNGTSSEWKSTSSGVPQGSVFVPLNFN